MRFCTDCGTRLADGARFCTSCGHRIAQLPPDTGTRSPRPAGSSGAPGSAAGPPSDHGRAASASGRTDGTLVTPAMWGPTGEQTVHTPATADAGDTTDTEFIPVVRPEVATPTTWTGPDPSTPTMTTGPLAPTEHTDTERVETNGRPEPDRHPETPPTPPSSPRAGSTAAGLRARAAPMLADVRPGAMTRPQILAAARDGALAYGATLAALTALVTLIALLSGGEHRGAPVDWFRTATMLVGLGLHAPVDLTVPGLGRLSITATPLVVTLFVAAVIAVVTWRAARSRPAGAPGTALPEAAVTGATIGVLAALVAAIGVGPLGYARSTTLGAEGLSRVGASPLVTLLSATVLGTLVALAGRAAAGVSGWRARRERVGAVLGPWRPHVRLARDLTLGILLTGILTGVILTAANGEWSPTWLRDAAADIPGADIPTTDLPDAGVGSWWVVLLLLPNILVTLGGFGMGGSLAVDGSAAAARSDEPFEYHNAVGLLTGTAGLHGLLWCVLAVALVTLVVGVRAALRHAPEDRLASRWWQPAVVMALTWAVLAWLTRVGAGGSGSLPFVGDVDARGTLGLGLPSTMLMAAAWAVLAAVAGPQLARAVGGTWPQVATRLGGRQLHPAWATLLADAELRAGRRPTGRLEGLGEELREGRRPPPTHPLGESRDRDRKILLTVGGVLAAVVLLALLRSLIAATLFTPERAVSSYLDAVEAKNAQEALQRVSDSAKPDGAAPLLHDAAMGALPEHDLDDADGTGDSRTVTARFVTEGGDVRRTFEVTREGTAFGTFDEWKVTDPFSQVTVESLEGGTTGDLKIDEAAVKLGDAQSLLAFPGIHDVTATPQSGFEVAPVKIVALEPRAASVSVDGSVSPQGQAALDAAVKKLVDGCAAQTTADPAGCRLQTWGLVEPVRYRVVSYPTVTLQPAMEPDQAPSVRTVRPGTLQATSSSPFGGTQSQTVSFEVEGDFTWSGGAPGDATIFTAAASR